MVVRGKPTILLVDDDEGVRTFLSEVLTQNGFHVLCAAHAQEALEESAAYDGAIHLLVSDIQMPPGLTGIDLAIRLRIERPEMKIILMSGVIFETKSIDQRWDFVHKPLRIETLKQDIQHLLGDFLAGTKWDASVGRQRAAHV